jgi:cadmium resistance protein CadD (predicted permease)
VSWPLPRIWLAALALGAAAAVLATLFGVLGVFFVLFIIPGMSRGTWLTAMSGALVGFGAVWLGALLRASASGGSLSDATIWLLVGIVPLALGVTFGLLAIASAQHEGT